MQRLQAEKAQRIIIAVLQNIGNWRDRALEIEEHANPGNKLLALSLARDLEMCRISLRRLAELPEDDR
jgi:hypothetical protein